MIAENDVKTNKNIKTYRSTKTRLIIVWAVVIAYSALFVAQIFANEVTKGELVFFVILASVGIVVTALLIYGKRVLLNFALLFECNPYSFRLMREKKGYLSEHDEMVYSFYTGDFGKFKAVCEKLLVQEKSKKKKCEILRLMLQYAIINNESPDTIQSLAQQIKNEKIKLMASTEMLLDFSQDFSGGDYAGAVLKLNVESAKVLDLEKSVFSYLRYKAYTLASDEQSANKCLAKAIQIDNKSWFGHQAKELLHI